jgi:hypothetical protein
MRNAGGEQRARGVGGGLTAGRGRGSGLQGTRLPRSEENSIADDLIKGVGAGERRRDSHRRGRRRPGPPT